ncbi:MAG: hypothetical protein AAB539_03195 [Patescibacteria group bacterium]
MDERNNKKSNKKILIVSAVLLLLVGAAVYLLFFAPSGGLQDAVKKVVGDVLDFAIRDQGPTGEVATTTRPKPGPPLPPAGIQRLIQLTDFPVLGPAFNRDQLRIRYYKKDGGDLYESDFIGTIQEKISNITIVGLAEVIPHRDTERAALLYLDKDTLKGFLHSATSAIEALPDNIRSFSWSPDGGRFVRVMRGPNGADVVIANGDGSNAQKIYSSPIPDITAEWIASDTLSLATPPSLFAQGFLFTLTRSTGALKRIMGPEFGLMHIWRNDGARLITTNTPSNKNPRPVLTLRGADGALLKTLPITTLPSKCAWSKTNTYLFCAVPRRPLTGFWPDNYLRGEINTEDNLLAYNLETDRYIIMLSDHAFDMTDLVVTDDDRFLFFIDRRDGTLWSFRIRE